MFVGLIIVFNTEFPYVKSIVLLDIESNADVTLVNLLKDLKGEILSSDFVHSAKKYSLIISSSWVSSSTSKNSDTSSNWRVLNEDRIILELV